MKAVPKIPGYELLACLGGGMLTSVYAARRIEDDLPCALKLLRPDWTEQPIAIKLLQREARACFAVRHPHLVEMIEAHVTRPPYYLVLAMLPGESLRRRLRREYQLEVPTALWLTRQVAQALAALNRKGFLHGDVKPDNVRILEEGKAVLLDLGFAHRPGENAPFMEKGYVLGTANYLAPELCTPQPRDDHRGDIFSLGIMLFEMLTGQLPYPAGTERETLRRHQSDAPADLGDFLPHPQPGLPELVDRMLALDPEDRPHALEVVQELVGFEIQAMKRRRAG